MSSIKLFVMDVDGTLTDGKIYMGQDGEIAKAFDIKDGCGILLELPKLDITPAIITARKSKILENRCREINIQELHQGSKNKMETLCNILEKFGVGLDSVAYVGDDLPDIPCMEAVKKAGGIVLCPTDAIPEVKVLSDYISGCKAGEGAIRDCIRFLSNHKKGSSIEDRIKTVVDYILNGQYEDKSQGILPDGSKYTIQEYITMPERDCIIETHNKHIVIQYMIEGCEEIRTYGAECLTSTGACDGENDTEYWRDGCVASHSIFVPGSLIILMKNTPYKAAILHKKSGRAKKLICKVRM